MTLLKSIMLGSAAGIVAVASAQAADLPTRKGPVAAEYVRVCSITVAGAPVVGFVLPGSDTCLRVSGYVTGHIEGGNIYQSYSVGTNPTVGASAGSAAVAAVPAGTANVFDVNGNPVTVTTTPATPATPATAASGGNRYQTVNGYSTATGRSTDTFSRNAVGFTARYNLTLDAVSNTAYGPLVAHGEYQFNFGTGFDTTGAGGSDGGLNRAYVTWAGITAGKIDSFFAFVGGGFGYANFFSPDRKGFNQPDVLAYTASFGGGFAATISLESAGPGFVGINSPGTCNGSFGCGFAYASGSEVGIVNGVYGGQRWPDIVGALDVKQAWGSAHIGGVAHNVRAVSSLATTDAAGLAAADNTTLDRWGWAVDAGVQFNIPNMAGSIIGVTGSYAHSATWYSGLPDAMWDGTPNDNGQTWGYELADAAYNGTGLGWSTPDAWSVTAYTQFKISPQVTFSLEGSYGQINWSGRDATSMLANGQGYLAGAILNYDPVKNLDFQFELLYMASKLDTPPGYLAAGTTAAGGTAATTCPVGVCTSSWHGNSDGFAGRFQITRSF